MSELFESQQLKTVPYCNDRPPQYDPCQPSQDVLTSVIENVHTRRILVQRVDEWNRKALSLSEITPIEPGYFQAANFCLEMSQFCTEGAQIATELANVYKERTVRNIELYTAMERLTESEFNRAYASLGRDANQQMRHQLAQDHEDHGDCSRESGYNSKQIEPARDCTCDSPCSRDQFFELSAKVDEINDKLSQSLQSLDTASVSKATHNAPAKPPKSFWKRILKHSAQP
ncbi:hypothetical protein E8E15_009392 [Penicillium rubens]|jgi:hypothetical protein|uniref:Uncharacterized protein n=1 Tax=Penicillium chrysogenum TaxID=5076 RepID=A0A167VN84_PENCH|nr:uncharacterized protein N7525_004411 [Penicillium rubens]KZN90709.1 hypothetical protein EN45_008320 [Penicillium chrysogenum]KAF3029387.1 hypothetical protein E8E15_009392 [Penicillium rubens]KAJ5044805.1 hypothetical protein NUH16_001611 [Penicillium rubens]KAJ5839223.1 hypothetical protein N7525_004411 [Penicillium rubens]KAJ5867276.1 hypothetical protein N7534_001829 [Penicillium rubens]